MFVSVPFFVLRSCMCSVLDCGPGFLMVNSHCFYLIHWPHMFTIYLLASQVCHQILRWNRFSSVIVNSCHNLESGRDFFSDLGTGKNWFLARRPCLTSDPTAPCWAVSHSSKTLPLTLPSNVSVIVVFYTASCEFCESNISVETVTL